ncbi:hypothetical protein PAPYR_1460 [Paratrimastix pyriformis]|uniref:Uncharacterized protein n=1 Tax=Paratrimastix pyriformis TaxID=342808 RepID=A0ABQ8URN7_9EUKA|nr:hypothetical protein PAPYR_1460 [Paratrimastix pyriformis]
MTSPGGDHSGGQVPPIVQDDWCYAEGVQENHKQRIYRIAWNKLHPDYANFFFTICGNQLNIYNSRHSPCFLDLFMHYRHPRVYPLTLPPYGPITAAAWMLCPNLEEGDDDMLIVLGDASGCLQLLSLAWRTVITAWQVHGGPVTSIAVHGNRILSHSSAPNLHTGHPAEGGVVALSTVDYLPARRTAAMSVETFGCGGTGTEATCMGFLPSGQGFLSAHADHSLHLWFPRSLRPQGAAANKGLSHLAVRWAALPSDPTSLAEHVVLPFPAPDGPAPDQLELVAPGVSVDALRAGLPEVDRPALAIAKSRTRIHALRLYSGKTVTLAARFDVSLCGRVLAVGTPEGKVRLYEHGDMLAEMSHPRYEDELLDVALGPSLSELAVTCRDCVAKYAARAEWDRIQQARYVHRMNSLRLYPMLAYYPEYRDRVAAGEAAPAPPVGPAAAWPRPPEGGRGDGEEALPSSEPDPTSEPGPASPSGRRPSSKAASPGKKSRAPAKRRPKRRQPASDSDD